MLERLSEFFDSPEGVGTILQRQNEAASVATRLTVANIRGWPRGPKVATISITLTLGLSISDP